MSKQPTSDVKPDRLMSMAFGYAPPLILEAGVRLGAFEALAEGPKTVEQLATTTGASPRGLRILLNALVGLQFMTKQGDAYALAPEAAAFLVRGKQPYFGGFFRHASSQLIPKWLQLTEIVRTGQPAGSVNQQDEGAAFFEQFVEDLFPMNYGTSQALAEHLGVPKLTRPYSVLDLAAGSGVWSIGLAEKSSHVRVRAVDWAGVLPATRRTAERHKVAGRYTFVAGDLLEADFGTGHDVATLGHILHSEGEARSRALLKKTYAALAPGGTVAVAEWLVDDDRTGPANGLIFAVNMLVNTDAGDTFSFREIADWLAEAGFVRARTFETAGPSPLVLADRA
jgi:ubiquinone/menaquinone biosynthesis C-methylase UbiE